MYSGAKSYKTPNIRREQIIKGYSRLHSVSIITLIFIPTLLFSSCREARVVDSFPAPASGGLAFDGASLWLAGGDTIWQLDTSGQIIDFFDAPGNGVRGISFGGTYFFASSGNTIYKLDPEMNVIDAFKIAVIAIAEDIAFDGAYLWLVDFFADNIYKLDIAGNPLDVLDAPCKDPFGLCFDGVYLWLACAEGVRGFTMLYKLDTASNVIDSFSGPGISPSGLACEEHYLWLSAVNDNFSGAPFIYKLNISDKQQ